MASAIVSDWTVIDEQPRPVPAGIERTYPQGIIWELMRDHRRSLDQAAEFSAGLLETERSRLTSYALDVAGAMHQFRGLLRRVEGTDWELSLRACSDMLNRAIDRAGFRLMDPEGQPYDDGISEADWAEVRAWIDGDVDVPMVTQTIEPAVYHGDRLIQTAKIIVAVRSKEATRQSELDGGDEDAQ